jgi:hypothetical protein
MVTVFMGDNDTINFETRDSEERKSCRYLPGGQTCVDKNLRTTRFDIQGVSLAAAGKQTYPQMSS